MVFETHNWHMEETKERKYEWSKTKFDQDQIKVKMFNSEPQTNKQSVHFENVHSCFSSFAFIFDIQIYDWNICCYISILVYYIYHVQYSFVWSLHNGYDTVKKIIQSYNYNL